MLITFYSFIISVSKWEISVPTCKYRMPLLQTDKINVTPISDLLLNIYIYMYSFYVSFVSESRKGRDSIYVIFDNIYVNYT